MSRGAFHRHILAASCAAAIAVALAAPPAHALKVATWNVLAYPTDTVTRNPNFRIVMAGLSPDLIVCEEMNSLEGETDFLNQVLNAVEPGQWSGGWKDVTTGEGMGYFWKSAKLSITAVSAIPTSGPRDVLLLRVLPVGYGSTTTFRVYAFHLKAGNPAFTPGDSTTRRLECTDIRNALNNVVSEPFMIGGDSNFYGDDEGGYIRLTESQTDNDGRCKDPLVMPGPWHSNSGYAQYDTQSPCLSGCPSYFSGGGMDDRFDLWLTSYSMQDGVGYELLPSTYTSFGNDVAHFNDDINGSGFNNAVGIVIATALHGASDHLPVTVVVQTPAKIVAASALDFGAVITGVTAQRTLTVSDVATPPSANLNYSFVAPSGFTAPSGSFVAVLNAPGNAHTIGMDTSVFGTKSGTLTVACDAPDSANKPVKLSGKVLRHAQSSLDSLDVVTHADLYLGAHLSGTFTDMGVRVYNTGWSSDQARLVPTSASIVGGDGRFSVVGFTPDTLGGVGRTYAIHFDDSGATVDSMYSATLTIQTSDEAVPGAAVLTPLTVALLARPSSTLVGVPTTSALPHELRFYPARPNPLARETSFAFDLPAPASVSLEVFDLTGRRVARLADGEQGAGRHEVRWTATDDGGARLAGGLYFARFQTRGLTRTERVIVLP